MKTYKLRKKAVKKVFLDTYNLSTNHSIARYIESYIDCEVLAQKIIRFYKSEINKVQPKTLYLPNIIKSIKHFDIDLSNTFLAALFSGGEGKRHKKTPRQLRNAYVHSKKEADALEIIDNYDQHMELMRTFKMLIKQCFV